MITSYTSVWFMHTFALLTLPLYPMFDISVAYRVLCNAFTQDIVSEQNYRLLSSIRSAVDFGNHSCFQPPLFPTNSKLIIWHHKISSNAWLPFTNIAPSPTNSHYSQMNLLSSWKFQCSRHLDHWYVPYLFASRLLSPCWLYDDIYDNLSLPWMRTT